MFCFLLTSKISAYFKFRSKAVFPPGVKEAENTSTFFLTVLENSRNPPAVYIFKKKNIYFLLVKRSICLEKPLLLIEKLLITYSSKHFFELNIGQGRDFGGF